MQIKIIGFDYDKWEFTNHKLFIIFTLSVKIRRYQNIFIFWSIPYGIMLSRSTDLVIMQLLYRTSIIMVPSTMVYSRSNEHTLDKTVNTFYAAQGGGAVAEVRAQGPLSPPPRLCHWLWHVMRMLRRVCSPRRVLLVRARGHGQTDSGDVREGLEPQVR